MKTFDVYWRLKRETEAAWQAQRDLCDQVYPPHRTEGATPEEAEAIDAATRLATMTEDARQVAYRAWQDTLACRHDWVTNTTGSIRFIGGEVVEDLHDIDVCRLCGQEAE